MTNDKRRIRHATVPKSASAALFDHEELSYTQTSTPKKRIGDPSSVTSKVILSLTAIPPRFPFLPKVLEGMAAQSCPPDKIELYLPRVYRRQEFNDADLPKLPNLSDWCEVIYVEEDLGPATKILPAAKRYRGEDICLVYCDDDKIYDPRWLETLVKASKAYPNHVIAHNGQPSKRQEAKARWKKKGLDYKLRRLASFGRWKPIKSRASYVPDIAEGFGGVLIRPDFVGEAAYSIPDILWTVDDVWLSGIYQMNGHGLKLVNAHPPMQNNEILHEGKTLGRQHALFHHVQDGHDRIQANAACIRYMRKEFGVYS